MNLTKYNKLFVAIATLALNFVPAIWPNLPPWWSVIVSVLGLYGIYRIPNIDKNAL